VIVDAHCHAWRYWPYQPPVPDPTSRGTVEQLLFEMDQNGVDRAAVVCARIDHNPDNNDYIAECVRANPTRLYQIADVDCEWMPTYHTPGAASRLAEAIDQYQLKGFTHYVKPDDDGEWFLSEDGRAFFDVAAARGQVVSMSLPVHLQPRIRRLAERYPSVPFLCHHLAGARATEAQPYERFNDIVRSAAYPNISIKLSGFHYASAVPWDFPYRDCEWIIRGLYESFGPDRLCWGSDYPVVRRAMTYQQSLEAFRTHCAFVPPTDQAKILGENLVRLLGG
jgi:L-fuconolactonase